jgi:hypothetical protein
MVGVGDQVDRSGSRATRNSPEPGSSPWLVACAGTVRRQAAQSSAWGVSVAVASAASLRMSPRQ